jgi:hypothetical protein
MDVCGQIQRPGYFEIVPGEVSVGEGKNQSFTIHHCVTRTQDVSGQRNVSTSCTNDIDPEVDYDIANWSVNGTLGEAPSSAPSADPDGRPRARRIPHPGL